MTGGPDWYDADSAEAQLCPACADGGHCVWGRGGAASFCECPCTEDLRPFSADVLDYARQALARARAVSASTIAATDQMTAGLRVRQSQLGCARCFGDRADPAWPAVPTGRGRCTCEARCARLCCDPPAVWDLP
jgi:hypothetical protein